MKFNKLILIERMNKLWKNELKSQCLWSFYKDYDALLKSDQKVKFADSITNMNLMLSAFRQSENLIPFCMGVNNFDCNSISEKNKFESSSNEFNDFVDVLNDNHVNKLYCQFYMAVGQGSGMFCFGGTFFVSALNRLEDTNPLLWLKRQTHSTLFKRCSQSEISFDPYDGINYTNKLPTKEQFSQMLFNCLSTENQINFGFYSVPLTSYRIGDTILFGNGERYYEVFLNVIQRIAPNSLIIKAYQEHHINKITIRSINNQNLKIIAKLFQSNSDICKILDDHCTNYRLLVIFKELNVSKFIDGTAIDDFMKNNKQFYRNLKNKLLNDELLLDQYQTALVYRSIPSSLSSCHQIYLFATWNAYENYNFSLQCDHSIKVIPKDNNHRSDISLCQQTLFLMTLCHNQNLQRDKFCCGCSIIYDDTVFTFDCCGRLLYQNLISDKQGTNDFQRIGNIHPDEARTLMIQHIKNVIQYHQNKSNLINRAEEIKQGINNLKFIAKILDPLAKQKNCGQRIKITNNFYANLYFGVQK